MSRAGPPGRFRSRRRAALCRRAALALAALLPATGCLPRTGEGAGEPVNIRVRQGAPFAEVTDSLAAHGIVKWPGLFRQYARFRDAATRIKPGTYAFRAGSGWDLVLDALVDGRFLTVRLVLPEGIPARDVAARLADITHGSADSLRAVLEDTASAGRWEVPGPTLEGYLYPSTYDVAVDATAQSLIDLLVRTYKEVWTPGRRARADSLGLSEREVVTLASIVEKEAVHAGEMPLIAAVYHRRLRIGMALQADPTVQYALGEHRTRLLFADIQRVKDHPYNTYTRPGLPPGPIAAASERAIDAVLNPAAADYLYFVARPDGTHVFSRTLAEHNRAVAEMRRLRREAERARLPSPSPSPSPFPPPPSPSLSSCPTSA